MCLMLDMYTQTDKTTEATLVCSQVSFINFVLILDQMKSGTAPEENFSWGGGVLERKVYTVHNKTLLWKHDLDNNIYIPFLDVRGVFLRSS